MTNMPMGIDHTTESDQRVTEPVARAAYLAMPTPRSLRRLGEDLGRRGGRTPSQRTLENWSRKHGWVRLVREHDARVADGAAKVVEKAAIKDAAAWAMELRRKAQAFLDAAELNVGKADAAQLARAALDMLARADELEGGVSGRTGTVTDDPGAAAKAEADRIRGLINKARGAARDTKGAGANGRHQSKVNSDGAPPETHCMPSVVSGAPSRQEQNHR